LVMLALAAPLASAAPLRFSYNFLLPPHSPVIPAHLKFPYRSCPPTRPAPASAQPSFCAGFAAQKLLIRFAIQSLIRYSAVSQCDQKIDVTFDQFAVKRLRISGYKMKHDARIAPGQAINGSRDKARSQKGIAPL